MPPADIQFTQCAVCFNQGASAVKHGNYMSKSMRRSMHKSDEASRWSVEVEMQVQFFDLDPMQIVWHGNYVKYLEVARCALLDSIHYNYVEMKASGYAWPVIDMQLRYVGSASFGQRLKLRADIVEWENRLKIDYLITDAQTGKR